MSFFFVVWKKSTKHLLKSANSIFSQKTFAPLNKAIGDLLKNLSVQYQKTIQILTDLYKSVYDTITEHAIPELKASFKVLETVLRDIYEETLKTGLKLFELLVEKLKVLEPELKELSKFTSKWAKKVAEIVNKQIDQINKEVNDLYQFIVDFLKSVPAFDGLKEKFAEVYNSFIVPDNIVGLLNNIADTLKDALNVPDLNELLKSIISYIEKVILISMRSIELILISVCLSLSTETEESRSQ